MILRVTSAQVCGPCQLELAFNNGVAGRVDVTSRLQGPIFEPLRAPEYFAQVKLDTECGTIVWPNGADFAPETLLELAAESTQPKLAEVSN